MTPFVLKTPWPLRLNVLIALFWLLIAPPVFGADHLPGSAAPGQNLEDLHRLPSEYGEIIYRKNAAHPRQIYIIGQSHRSVAGGRLAEDTVRVQTEIYRIGEWLARKAKVELLLPEGYFRKTPAGPAPAGPPPQPMTGRIGNEELLARLSDNSRFVNAGMLLNVHCNLRLGQVENERLYREVRRLLREAGDDLDGSVYPRLVSTQEERTVAMLSNIPQAVEQALQDGKICSPQAIFTIGLAHIRDIIDLLQSGSPQGKPAGPVQTEGLAHAKTPTGLQRLEKGYGVTVILPRSLAQNKELLRLTELQTL